MASLLIQRIDSFMTEPSLIRRFGPSACGCLWFEHSLGLLNMVFLWLIRARCLL